MDKNIINKINQWKAIRKELMDELDRYFDDIMLVDKIPEDAIGNEEEGYYQDMDGCVEDMAVLYVIEGD